MLYYGSSGDVRDDLNGGLPSTHDNYMGEAQLSGSLIERGRRHAYSIINGKLSPAYPNNVPWASGSEPALIYEIANKLSMCFVLTRKNPGQEPLDKNRREQYCEEPMQLLDQLASFEMELEEIDKPLGDKVYHTRDYTPACDVDAIENQEIDSDLLDHIADERL
jgi:hypothetical protein